jgi:UDP-glucose:(heptosyl)LPS alpha-1,3-glucosyltransferase
LPWITFHGWTAQVPFGEYDLLIHPAREEPFGMIVPEALASGCKVLVSENVGAGEIISENLRSIEISQSSDNWASELEKFLREPLKGNSFEYNDWISVAKNHVGLYRGIQPSCR